MLRGAIPLSVGNLRILRALDFEDETPSDAIPSQLSGLAALLVPGLRKNRLAGVIPVALARVPALLALNTRVNDLRARDIWAVGQRVDAPHLLRRR